MISLIRTCVVETLPYNCLFLTFRLTNVRTLDVSLNKLQTLPMQLSASLANLKSFKCDENQLSADSLNVISKFSKLQILSMQGNRLGQRLPSEVPKKKSPAPMILSIDDCSDIPKSLKQVNMSHNMLSKVPPCLYNVGMKLEKLDVSFNRIISIPAEIFHLKGTLTEINLDNNTLVSLPVEMGMLTKLKSLSLKNNHISKNKNKRDPQPLPSTLFTDTPLIDLNLHGNPMTNTELVSSNIYFLNFNNIMTLHPLSSYNFSFISIKHCFIGFDFVCAE